MANKIKKLLSLFYDKNYRFRYFRHKGYYNKLSDEEFVKLQFEREKGEKLDLEKPQTFDEKLQWLKLHDRQPIYTTLVDKYEVKKYIADKIGKQYVIPTLGLWDKAEDIDFDSLPNQFVLKTTHDSHGVVICKDKSKLNIEQAKQKLNESLHTNYYYYGREWPYKDVKPRVIAEKYMTDAPESKELTDYKFYCFHGMADCVLVCFDREIGDPKFYFFDKEWKLKRHNKRGKEAPVDFTMPKPVCIDEMFHLAEVLSEGIPAVRVDLYQSNGHPYFGELTFYPQSGCDPNRLREADLYFGSLIDLSKVTK